MGMIVNVSERIKMNVKHVSVINTAKLFYTPFIMHDSITLEM